MKGVPPATFLLETLLPAVVGLGFGLAALLFGVTENPAILVVGVLFLCVPIVERPAYVAEVSSERIVVSGGVWKTTLDGASVRGCWVVSRWPPLAGLPYRMLVVFRSPANRALRWAVIVGPSASAVASLERIVPRS